VRKIKASVFDNWKTFPHPSGKDLKKPPRLREKQAGTLWGLKIKERPIPIG